MWECEIGALCATNAERRASYIFAFLQRPQVPVIHQDDLDRQQFYEMLRKSSPFVLRLSRHRPGGQRLLTGTEWKALLLEKCGKQSFKLLSPAEYTLYESLPTILKKGLGVILSISGQAGSFDEYFELMQKQVSFEDFVKQLEVGKSNAGQFSLLYTWLVRPWLLRIFSLLYEKASAGLYLYDKQITRFCLNISMEAGWGLYRDKRAREHMNGAGRRRRKS